MKAATAAAIDRMSGTFAGDHRPVHHERAAYVDEYGYATLMLTGYWIDPSAFAAWWARPAVKG